MNEKDRTANYKQNNERDDLLVRIQLEISKDDENRARGQP